MKQMGEHFDLFFLVSLTNTKCNWMCCSFFLKRKKKTIIDEPGIKSNPKAHCLWFGGKRGTARERVLLQQQRGAAEKKYHQHIFYLVYGHLGFGHVVRVCFLISRSPLPVTVFFFFRHLRS
mmetsp:Transcript_33260/g.85393  ORF Transcript_33260/g.85393 Transcript_33260/m.85393 type:complete len:121 (+) Transcript_33260:132-494(+)